MGPRFLLSTRTHHGVELWVAQVGGKVDPGSDAHDLLMQVKGGMSKGERNRIKVRVRSAVAAQAQHEGRSLGDRPPYGHQLVDAGPHPNPSKAYMVSGSVALSLILPRRTPPPIRLTGASADM
jgi:DNA invertase Pin-like site-specific DNA recombinase